MKEIAASQPSVAQLLKSEAPLKDFLSAAFSLSPYLRETAAIAPDLLATALDAPLDEHLAGVVQNARDSWQGGASEAELMTALRKAKREVSFLVALADLAGIFETRETTGWLSRMADAAVASAMDHLLLNAHASGKLKLSDPEKPSAGSGVVVLGMGKLGAFELNYSSDHRYRCVLRSGRGHRGRP